MTAWKLIPATSMLAILIVAGLLGASMLPATSPHPRPAPSEAAVAKFIVGMSIRSNEFGIQQPHDYEGSSETLRFSDNETLSGRKNWHAFIERAAELMYRLEAEIARQLGRVAS
jgi:hypothetical protein